MSVSCLACLPLYKRTLLVGVYYTTWVYACLQSSQFTNAHCKKYLVTAVSGFIEHLDGMIKGIPKHNWHPSTPS